MIEVESIIGVDCACQENRVGLARAEKDGKVWDLREVTMGSRQRPAADIIQEWLEERRGKAILALDAPLGWPAPLRSMVMGHRAGEGVRGEPNMVFQRESDRFVASLLGKTPLDVGADRIARTAHWALSLLEALRARLDQPISLAWKVPPAAEISAIEVYPAGTLRAYECSLEGYKAKAGMEAKKAIASDCRSPAGWIRFAPAGGVARRFRCRGMRTWGAGFPQGPGRGSGRSGAGARGRVDLGGPTGLMVAPSCGPILQAVGNWSHMLARAS